MVKKVKTNTIKSNPANPRIIKNQKFKDLVESMRGFPEMLEKRAIVVDEDMMILGGNMRFKAWKETGFKDVWIDIANGWNPKELKDWGIDVWQPEEAVDYSILEDDDLSIELEDMKSNVRKAIQIEFELEHYGDACDLVRFFRKEGSYIGGMFMQFLKDEKNKL